jgi:RNA polymerase sigma factor (sigma-70 family)
MAATPISEVLDYLREALVPHQERDQTDGQLLAAFVEQRDEAAIAALVQRHAAMVWGVCRRVLRNQHDAEDAFQATFLVLVRRAVAIASPELLAGWLHGVALKTASKARAMAAKRRSRERQVTSMPEPEARPPAGLDDPLTLLDGELGRLPVRYRTAVVLCDLEGCTRKEAALQLGVPEGTVAARLARARAMLAKRLLRRGQVLSSPAPLGLSSSAMPACVPAAVVSATIRSAALVAAEQMLAEGAISPTVAALMQGVLKAMLLRKLQTVTAVLLVLAMVALGGGLLARHGAAQSQAEKPVAGADRAAEARKKKAEAIAQERKRLAGTWQLIGVERDGKKAPRKEVDEIAHHKIIHYVQNLGVKRPNTAGVKFVVVFDGQGKWKEQTHGGNMKVPRLEGDKVVHDRTVIFAEGTSEIDPTAKVKTMDCVVTRQVVGKGYTKRGIYEFVNKDSWRVCFGEPGKDRPTSFAKRMLWVFQRVKEDKGK